MVPLRFFQSPLSIQDLIQMAIKFIEFDQCHSGFPEMADPEKGGIIEVTIQQDLQNGENFHVTFTFVAISGNSPNQHSRDISYSELVRLADGYKEKPESIDTELARREESFKLLIK